MEGIIGEDADQSQLFFLFVLVQISLIYWYSANLSKAVTIELPTNEQIESLRDLVPDGYKVLTTGMDLPEGGENWLKPGTKVDLRATYRPSDGVKGVFLSSKEIIEAHPKERAELIEKSRALIPDGYKIITIRTLFSEGEEDWLKPGAKVDIKTVFKQTDDLVKVEESGSVFIILEKVVEKKPSSYEFKVRNRLTFALKEEDANRILNGSTIEGASVYFILS